MATTLNGALGDTFPETSLVGDIDTTTTSISVIDASGFPSPNFNLRIDCEIMEVISVDNDVFTVIRGQEGTTAAQHFDGVRVSTLEDIEVVDASGFPSPRYRIQVDSETMLVMSVSGNTLTVVRGDLKTTVDSHADSTPISYIRTIDIGSCGTEVM